MAVREAMDSERREEVGEEEEEEEEEEERADPMRAAMEVRVWRRRRRVWR